MKKSNCIKLITALSVIISVLFIFSCKKNKSGPELIATSIELVSGNNQIAEVKDKLTNQIGVIVKDQNGNPYTGANVNFAVSEGKILESVITDGNGYASADWTLGQTEGSQTLIITALKNDGTTPVSGSPITVYATGKQAAYSIELTAGSGQLATIETALGKRIEIIVVDRNGNPFVGKKISFNVSEGSVIPANDITDFAGKVSAKWILGTTEGNQILTIEAFKPNDSTALVGAPIKLMSVGEAVIPVTDVDGNEYKTVRAGNKLWMAENLRVTHYDNSGTQGDAIPFAETDNAWGILGNNNTDKAYCWYNNDEESNKDIYGALYTYAAAMNGVVSSSENPSGVQGVCPAGWHLPSNAEWSELVDYLGGKSIAGGKMKEVGTTHWNSPNEGATNESGFLARPGGFRHHDDGASYNICYNGGYWSTTEFNSTSVYCRTLYGTDGEVHRLSFNKSKGYSVRCVKD